MPLPDHFRVPISNPRAQDIFQHPGWSVTVNHIYQYRLLADAGDLCALYDAYDDLYGDGGTLAGLVDQRVGAIVGCEVTITPGEHRHEQRAEAEENADAFREMWSRLDHRELIRWHQRNPLMYGFGNTEMIWDWVSARHQYEIVNLLHLRARFHRVATSSNPWIRGARPNELLVQTDESGSRFARLTAGKFLESRMQSYDMPLQRQGLMYQSAICAVMKRDALADWFLFISRHGLPFIEAEISSWTDPDAVAQARNALASVGTTKGFISATSDKVQFHIHDSIAASRSANSDVHQRFVQACDTENAKRWNGAALPTESTGSGSYALAKEQGGVRFALVRDDKDRIEKALQDSMIRPWMAFNERTGPAPRVRIALARVDDPKGIVDIAEAMTRIGASVDHGHLHQVTGLPPGAGNERAEAA